MLLDSSFWFYPYIIVDLDYMATLVPLEFDDNTTRACISIVIVDDTEPEDVEFFSANLITRDTRVQVTQGTTRINIIDNDSRKYTMHLCGSYDNMCKVTKKHFTKKCKTFHVGVHFHKNIGNKL